MSDSEKSGALGESIAVVGMSALFPSAPGDGALSIESFWRDIIEGNDRLSDVPRTHWLREDYFDARVGAPDRVYTTRGGFLGDVDFAPLEFGMPPSALSATDSAQLLALLAAKRVLQQATRGKLDSMDRSRISVILGVASATELVGHMSGRLQLPLVERAMRAAGVNEADLARTRDLLSRCYVPWQESTFPGLLGNVVAGRVANKFDLGGTNMVIDAACASSLAAIATAVNELTAKKADLVVTGGVDALNDILMFMCFAHTGALSPSGDCRPFSSDADGTLLGEGVGMIALKRLCDAERDKDSIFAVLRGIGTSSDGRATSIYAPLARGQANALRRAYESAGYGPETVGLVEAHGTATKAGDAAELESLRTVFEEAGARVQRCALGSVKSQIGHTKAAAGAAGLIKAVLALHHKVLPPTIKVTEPNAAFNIEASPFYLNTEARPWVRAADAPPRRASVSALGFGGTNFHITLEEYTGPAPRPLCVRAMPTELVLLGAQSEIALATACRDVAESARATGALSRVAKKTQLHFDASSPVRVAVIADSAADLVAKLVGVADALEKNPDAVATMSGVAFGKGPAAGPLAVLFPGQGSQYINMARDLALFFEPVRDVWAESESCDDVFVVPTFSDAARKTNEARLTATERAQPAIVTASLSIHRLLASMGVVPLCVGGHSLGEISALAAAGVVSITDAIQIARLRGEAMAVASRDASGAMTAVASDRATVARHVEGIAVSLANDNAPAQVVLSGTTDAIEEAEQRLGAANISFRRLSVSTAFHSPIVRDAVTPFRASLDAFAVHAARVPVFANATAAEYPRDGAHVRDALARSIAEPVRWREQIEAMYAAGARTFLEIGPDGVLTRLTERCLGVRPHVAVAVDRRRRNGVTSLWSALAVLSVNGVALDFRPVWDGFFVADEPAPETTAKLTVKVSGANYGKPSTEAVLASAPPRPVVVDVRPPAASMTTIAAPATSARAPEATTADAAWLRALGELHAPAIAAQREYERVMAESHIAFLRTIEASYRMLAPGAAPVVFEESARRALQAPDAPPAAHAPSPAPIAIAARAVEPNLPLKQAPNAPAAPAQKPIAAKMPVAAALAPVDLEALLLGVVAEKTGYPVEMVSLDMDLEGDLGIDSIKRVEILSALRERAPSLPEADTARLASQRTLRSILATIAGPSSFANASSAPVPSKNAPPKPAPSIPRAAVQTIPTNDRPAELVHRSVQRVTPSRSLGLCLPNLAGSPPVLVTPPLPIARAIALAFEARGVRAEVSDRVPDTAEAVVFIGGLVDRVRSRDEIVRVNRDAFLAARAVASRFRAAGGTFVTVQDTGGDFGRENSAGERAWLSGLVGLVRTAAEEWPLAHVRAIDIERAERDETEIAEALVAELTAGGLDEVVGLRADGSRITLASVEAPAAKRVAAAIEEKTVFVVSGGARGVTASSIVELARSAKTALRFLLLGRTVLADEPPAYNGIDSDADLKRVALVEARRESSNPTPKDVQRRVDIVLAGREIRATLRALAELGSEARYAAVSVEDRASLADVLSDVRNEWGPIGGVIHGAGVLEDAYLDQKTDEQFDRVFNTKVNGLSALLDATAEDPIRWLCVFSSVAARAGNAGQADYAMANEVLNVVAAREAERRGSSCRVVSIGWGPWDGGMVTPSLKEHFESRGVGVLSVASGARAFVHELASEGDVDVVIANASGSPHTRREKYVADILVDRETYPELESHRVLGVVVLPLVLALEWFARLAAPILGDTPFVTFDDVRVLRGVTLPSYGERPVRLRLVGELHGATLRVDLRDEAGGRRYSATVRAGEPSQIEPPVITPFDDVLSARPIDEIYGPNALFHGPHFQVLKSFEDASDSRAIGALVCGATQGLTIGAWHIDIAAIDGALQLAVLHARRRDGGLTLPLRVARVCCSRGIGPKPGQLRAVAETRARSPEKNVCSVVVTNAGGRSVIELDDAEIYAFPNGKD